MLRDAWFLVHSDLRYLSHRIETWVWAFAMPLLFFYFIGSITGSGNVGIPGRGDPIVIVEPGGGSGWLAGELRVRLKQRGFEAADAAPRRLILPADFTSSILAGRQAKVKLIVQGNGIGADYDKLRTQLAVYGVIADLIVTTKDGGPATPETFQQLAGKPRSLRMAVETAGRLKRAPSGFQQSVPGTMVMFTVLILFTTGAISLANERSLGILRRLASSPISRGGVVLGKWGARWILGLVQIAFAMLAGSILFHVQWGQNAASIAVLMMAYAALVAAMGIVLGNLARTPGQVIAFGVIASNVMAALGGCWWPIEITPKWAQMCALVLPTGWAMDALHRLMSFGEPAWAVLPHITVMLSAALVAGWIAARSFRFTD